MTSNLGFPKRAIVAFQSVSKESVIINYRQSSLIYPFLYNSKKKCTVKIFKKRNYPANTRRSANVVLMLAHRLRRRPTITQHWMSVSCLFAGYALAWHLSDVSLDRSTCCIQGYTRCMLYGEHGL